MPDRRVVMGLLFFPRGGSAQVTRYLAAALQRARWSVSLVAGSLGPAGQGTHAPTFFAGIPLRHLDYTPAHQAALGGEDPLAQPVPMHPSYEDRVGAPDVLLASVDPACADHLAEVWEAPLADAGAAEAGILHLHHLTPQHDAVERRWPAAPVVCHLHGTEIKFLEELERRAAVASALGERLTTMPEAIGRGRLTAAALDAEQSEILQSTRWSKWRHGEHWAAHIRRQAGRADHLVTVSPGDRITAAPLLGLPLERITAIPNGVDTERFRPRRLSVEERRACLRRWLVEDPRGWDEQGRPGSVAYSEDDLDRLLGPGGDATVLIYVGRFTGAKRVPLLVRAFSRAQARTARRMALLVWGGHPDEWEGEHPVAVAREVGAGQVFFTGWRGHTDLPDGLAASDILVMPSVNDSFAQTALESMAAGRPVLAARSGGFPSMINLDPARPTGWLVEPDDVEDLADTIVEVVDRPDEVARRGANALDHARAELSWDRRVRAFEEVYAQARDHRASCL